MSEELLPCPFCGCTPKTIDRHDNIDGTQFFFGVMCYCGGYSACAHKMAIRETADLAKADAIEAWNRRAAVDRASLEAVPNIEVVLDRFEIKDRGLPQAHIASELVAELRAMLSAAQKGQK